MNLSAMIAGTTGALLLAGLAIAQSPSPTPSAPPQPVIAQSAPDAAMARHTMEGQVTSVNPDKGQIHVKTTEGRMLLHFPTSALQSVRKGDSVTIELAMKDNGPALKMK